jgi:hypothetical protein
MDRHIFIVSRAHRELFEYLALRFSGEKNVEVVLDRRTAERRGRPTVHPNERRRRDRRHRPAIDEELLSRSHSIVTISEDEPLTSL